MIRNAVLRARHEASLGITRDHIDSGIAAMLLEEKSNKQMVAATGVPNTTINHRLLAMSRRAGARTRVGLALALQRQLWSEGAADGRQVAAVAR